MNKKQQPIQMFFDLNFEIQHTYVIVLLWLMRNQSALIMAFILTLKFHSFSHLIVFFSFSMSFSNESREIHQSTSQKELSHENKVMILIIFKSSMDKTKKRFEVFRFENWETKTLRKKHWFHWNECDKLPPEFMSICNGFFNGIWCIKNILINNCL